MSVLYVCPNCEDSQVIIDMFEEEPEILRRLGRERRLKLIKIDKKAENPYVKKGSKVIADGVDEIGDLLFPIAAQPEYRPNFEEDLPKLDKPRWEAPKQRPDPRQEVVEEVRAYTPPPRQPKSAPKVEELPDEPIQLKPLKEFSLDDMMR